MTTTRIWYNLLPNPCSASTTGLLRMNIQKNHYHYHHRNHISPLLYRHYYHRQCFSTSNSSNIIRFTSSSSIISKAKPSCSFTIGNVYKKSSISTDAVSSYFSSTNRTKKKNEFDKKKEKDNKNNTNNYSKSGIRLSKLLSHYAMNLPTSRREAERLIRTGQVTIAGEVITTPFTMISWETLGLQDDNNNNNKNVTTTSIVCKVSGKAVILNIDQLKGMKKQQEEEQTDQELDIINPTITNNNNNNNNKSNNNNNNTTSLSYSKNSYIEVWMVHKVSGELVSEKDSLNRPCVMDRVNISIKQQQQEFKKLLQINKKLKKNFPSKQNKHQQQLYHYKPIGRLDMATEGLLLVTNNGYYARDMELPSSQIHRIYRARVHGKLTTYKLDLIRNGRVPIVIEDDSNKNNNNNNNNRYYGPMNVTIEQDRRGKRRKGRMTNMKQIRFNETRGRRYGRQHKQELEHSSPSNTWVRITTTEGKNRQIRRVFEALGVTVSRLIRISYGDYDLASLQPGQIIQVPYKPIEKQVNCGTLSFSSNDNNNNNNRRNKRQRNKTTNHYDDDDDDDAPPVQWLHPSQL